MMRGNTTAIKLVRGIMNRAFDPLYQYDYGQKLIFKDTPLPVTYEVHFSNNEYDQSKVSIGNSEGVVIPDEYLLSGDPIYVWVFVHNTGEDGETEYRGIIPVIQRPQATDIPITPVQQDAVDQAIAELNAAVEYVNSNIEHYPQIIDGYWHVWDAENEEYISTNVEAKGDKGDVGYIFTPSVSENGVISWTNNGGLPNPPSVDLTGNIDLQDYARKEEVPHNLSDLTDDVGYYIAPTEGIPKLDLDYELISEIDGKLDSSYKGVAGGVAELDENGKIPSYQLPSYVDDVVEYEDYQHFPQPGESGILYVDNQYGEVYRWSGTNYVSISEAGADHAPKANPVFTGSISLGRKGNTIVGGRSSAVGIEVEASGANSHGEGNTTKASGENSHAEGSATKATAYSTHAEGMNAEATSMGAHAEGSATKASSYYAHAEGSSTEASGTSSHAEGNATKASGQNSHAEGSGTEARGVGAHAEGSGTKAIGTNSHAEGYNSTASDLYTHAEGEDSVASAIHAHAEGYKTTASGTNSHAEGLQTTASSSCAHAEGSNTIANVAYSHVSGKYNIADITSYPEWVSGTSYAVGDKIEKTTISSYNGIPVSMVACYVCIEANNDETFDSSKWEMIDHPSGHAEIIGNGINANNRSNARALDWYGNEYLKGDIYVGCNADSTGGTKVAKLTDIPSVPVTDVQVNGTSVISEGVANIPVAGTTTLGVVKTDSAKGLVVVNDALFVSGATSSDIKTGTNQYKPITPVRQNESVFYGLAKAAGDNTQSASNNAVGTYTNDAKSAIRTMLDVPATSDIPSVPVTDVQVNGTSIISNGVANIPVATNTTPGVVKVLGYGLWYGADGFIYINKASSAQIKQATQEYVPIVPYNQHESAFYGLAKAAGDSTQASSSNAVGTYTDAAKAAIRTMLGAGEADEIIISDTQPSSESNKLWIDNGAVQQYSIPTYGEMQDAIASNLKVSDVQVNGSSILNNGVANIPVMTGSTFGVAKLGSGLTMVDGTNLAVSPASSSDIKGGSVPRTPISPLRQHEAVFYGLAKAAGVDMSSSSNAVGTYTDAAKAAICAMIGAGSSSGSGAVSDVQINSTSILSSGIANIPITSSSNLGVCKINSAYGVSVDSSTGTLKTSRATSGNIKDGTHYYAAIVPCNQHEAAFYGLAKAAGDATQASSSNSVGTYTDGAKQSIQKMLGFDNILGPYEDDTVSDRAYAIGETFVMDGKRYKVTSAIAIDNTIAPGTNCALAPLSMSDVQINGTSVVSNGVANVPIASSSNLGVVKSESGYGIFINNQTGRLYTDKATTAHAKAGADQFRPIVPYNQHESTFYGLAKAAGDSTQASSDNPVGTYTSDAKSAIRTMIGAGTGNGTVTDVQINGTSVVSNGVANVPVATENSVGVSRPGGTMWVNANGVLGVNIATTDNAKAGTSNSFAISPGHQHESAFYGLAKASGDTTQSSSSNAVGTYTDSAKSSIQSMLGVIGNPTLPSSDGTYYLKCVISNGVPIYSWASLPVASGVSF